jgi:formate dehydrogenase major subunit
LTRRDFLKTSAAVTASATLWEFFLTTPVSAQMAPPVWRLEQSKETPTICCYCAVGCGSIVSTKAGEVVNIEGDPDHPVNRGALCSKGAAQFNLRSVYDPKTAQRTLNPWRNDKVRYRAPGSDTWVDKDWNWALDRIAVLAKKTRDATFEVTDPSGVTVNRTEAVGVLGGASLDDEECYLVQKFARSLGVTYLEHQARI